ncbi:MAG: hypothetical protein MJ227_02660 [Bacilli bacterium]|nr:hypothetical protein [Bacilli bacterium]
MNKNTSLIDEQARKERMNFRLFWLLLVLSLSLIGYLIFEIITILN